MKIRYKLTISFFIFALSITMLFYLIGLRNQNNNVERIAFEHIIEDKVSLNKLQARDSNMLFSTLEVIVQDPGLKEVYLEKNREKLHNYGQLLFQNLKNKYGITHFYFILPDGRVFLRMHNEEIYGDLVERHSFQKARDTGSPAWEIELGKTAFALRAVMPYYQAGKLIGYVELAEEIEHFLEILGRETHSEFGIIADKIYLDRGDWKSLRKVAGLRDNWDDIENHLILSSTSDGEMAAQCFVEDNLERVEKGQNILQQIQGQNGIFMCGGFELNDSGGRHIGAVLSLTNISDHVAAAKKDNIALIRLAIIFFFLIFTVGVLISDSITKPILKLAEVAKAVGRGNLDQKVSVSSTNEIGQLEMVFNDMIEKRKLYDEELKHTLDKLARSNSDLEQYAYIVSHDLKSPLVSISGFANLLEKNYKDKLDGEASQYIEFIINSSKRMNNIIDDLLTYARIDRSNKLSSVDLNKIFIRAIMNLSVEIEKNLAIITHDTLPTVIGNGSQLEQLFQNLIANAIKFHNQEPPKIHISAKQENKNWILTVSDNGIGIDSKDRENIFNMFVSHSDRSKYKGTGIGLAICKKVVDHHGGKIRVESELNKGSTFVISLPA
jgi:signal transduction histidine kinase